MTSEPAATGAAAVAAEADEGGIHLAADVTEVVDVFFGERRIWSVNPVRYPLLDDGMRTLRWPRVLMPRLHGRTHVSIRRHLSEAVLFSRDVTFGDSEDSLQVVDDEGHWLTVDKWGGLVAEFTELTADDRRALVAAVARLVACINDETPLDAFAAYGTLLGAVRSGALLGHDHDADIAYLSAADNPADLQRESFALQRFLRRKGWSVIRKSNGWLTAALDLAGGGRPHVDVFSAHFADGRFYLERWVCGPLTRNDIVPLGEVELEGVAIAAPRSPAAVLAATYGDGWVVPDPSFKYKTPRHVVDHFERWVGKGGGVSERRGWDRYHEASAASPQAGSDFANWVLQRLPDGAAVLDLGCGTGHDAARYAAGGHQVLGVDYSPTAVAMALEHTGHDPAITVETLNLLDLRRLLSRGSRFALDHPGPRAVTGRLVLDALPADACNHVWWLSRTVLLGNGGSLFLEVRTHDGVPCGHRDGAPWQTQVSSQRLVEEVIAHGGHVEEMADAPAPEGDATGLTGTSRLRVSWPERL